VRSTQQSGGRISIVSEVDVGTTVTLLLPRAERQPVAKIANAPSVAAPRTDTAFRGQVLLVEDDNEVASLTREMLSCMGFSVIHTASPDAALGALANGRDIQYVLSDIMMPGGINGVELAHEIKRCQPHLRVVLTTGYPEAAAGLDEQQFGLVLKPYTVEALADAFGISSR
jgi:CheY-like chemotaxis protein